MDKEFENKLNDELIKLSKVELVVFLLLAYVVKFINRLNGMSDTTKMLAKGMLAFLAAAAIYLLFFQ